MAGATIRCRTFTILTRRITIWFTLSTFSGCDISLMALALIRSDASTIRTGWVIAGGLTRSVKCLFISLIANTYLNLAVLFSEKRDSF